MTNSKFQNLSTAAALAVFSLALAAPAVHAEEGTCAKFVEDLPAAGPNLPVPLVELTQGQGVCWHNDKVMRTLVNDGHTYEFFVNSRSTQGTPEVVGIRATKVGASQATVVLERRDGTQASFFYLATQ